MTRIMCSPKDSSLNAWPSAWGYSEGLTALGGGAWLVEEGRSLWGNTSGSVIWSRTLGQDYVYSGCALCFLLHQDVWILPV